MRSKDNPKTRKSGVLLHVSSLPGEYSIGSLGKEAYEFCDLLSESGFKVWQVLPLCMTDEYNSPYQSYSSFAFNPYLIDLPTLFEKGYITKDELLSARQNSPYLAEYDRLKKERIPLLKLAAKRAFEGAEKEKIEKFVKENEELYKACLFLSKREKQAGIPWQKWKDDETDSDTLFFYEFLQYEFYTEWQALHEYANSLGISIVGDLPIYVSLDSADVWAHKDLFLLDSHGYPVEVSGVPPDYFSEDGQVWNNPLYNYKRMREDGFAFLLSRLSHAFKLFDGVRLDHFRGYESYYSIPYGRVDAKVGKWNKGPGRKLIDAIRKSFPDKLIIAEDLGDITDEVRALLDYSKFPGMKVLQFAFLGDTESLHLPHNYEEGCVAYTGTHDNNTLLGYVYEMNDGDRRRAFEYAGYYGEDFSEGTRALIRTVIASHADTVILPVQDLLLYGCDTRMNTPGVAEGNWAYRVTKEQMGYIDKEGFRRLCELYGR